VNQPALPGVCDFVSRDAELRAQRAAQWSAVGPKVLLLALLFLTVGCQQKMARQPSYRPLTHSDFFADGRASRPLVPGTVARRNVYSDDPQLDSGRIGDPGEASRLASLVGPRHALALGALTFAVLERNVSARYYKDFPFTIGEDELKRGQERFNIFCSVCHDRLGTGKGTIVQRGFTPPPSLLTDQSRGLKFEGVKLPLKEAPVGYLFEVVTRGYGAMPSYEAQIPPRDRWLIVAYVRALQAAEVRLDTLPQEEREKILKELKSGGNK